MLDEPRWLNDCERDAWMALAKLVFNLPGALDAQLLRDSGLTLFDYFMLSGLSMTPGRTQRLSDLASHIGCSLSRLSQGLFPPSGHHWHWMNTPTVHRSSNGLSGPPGGSPHSAMPPMP